jgi:hypothetical protein
MSETSNNTTTEQVSPTGIVILAADVLSTRAAALCDALAAGDWKPLADLKAALSTYAEVRFRNVLKDAADPDPQCMQVNDVPTCEGCKQYEQCSGIPTLDRDCFNPITKRGT